MASPSAWTAKAHGVTMSLSSGFGGRSNTRRYISEPTTRCPRPGLPSADTSASTTTADHTPVLAGRRHYERSSAMVEKSQEAKKLRRGRLEDLNFLAGYLVMERHCSTKLAV